MATHLTTDKYRQQDFFVADIFDASPKDERNSMEHPLFALRVGDMKERHYEHKGYRVDVLP